MSTRPGAPCTGTSAAGSSTACGTPSTRRCAERPAGTPDATLNRAPAFWTASPSGPPGGSRGYAVGKRVNGRKRHILVDTDRQLIAAHVTPASLSDHKGLKRLLAGLKPLVPRLRAIWADSAYAGDRPAAWCAAEGG